MLEDSSTKSHREMVSVQNKIVYIILKYLTGYIHHSEGRGMKRKQTVACDRAFICITRDNISVDLCSQVTVTYPQKCLCVCVCASLSYMQVFINAERHQ